MFDEDFDQGTNEDAPNGPQEFAKEKFGRWVGGVEFVALEARTAVEKKLNGTEQGGPEEKVDREQVKEVVQGVGCHGLGGIQRGKCVVDQHAVEIVVGGMAGENRKGVDKEGGPLDQHFTNYERMTIGE